MNKNIYEQNRHIIATNFARIKEEQEEISASKIDNKSDYALRTINRLLDGTGENVSNKVVNEVLQVMGMNEMDILKKNYAKNIKFQWIRNRDFRIEFITFFLMIVFGIKAAITKDMISIIIYCIFGLSTILNLNNLWGINFSDDAPRLNKFSGILLKMLVIIFIIAELFRGILF